MKETSRNNTDNPAFTKKQTKKYRKVHIATAQILAYNHPLINFIKCKYSNSHH